MKTLRLLVTENCNRNCDGCYNKQFDIPNLPEVSSLEELSQYDEIILTGGEPMLYPVATIALVSKIKVTYPKKTVYVYTADITNITQVMSLLNVSDGITVTLHEPKDLEDFYAFNKYLRLVIPAIKQKSLRLNVFSDIKVDTTWHDMDEVMSLWKIKDNITWIKNCPLPENETFKKLWSEPCGD